MNRSSFEEMLGALPGSVILAVPLAVVATWITAKCYSTSVLRSMSRTVGSSDKPFHLKADRPAQHHSPRSELRWDWIDGASPRPHSAGTVADRAETARRRQGVTQGLAGLAHTLIATLFLVGFVSPGFHDVTPRSFAAVAVMLFAPTIGAFFMARELPMRRTLLATTAYSLVVLLVLQAPSSAVDSELAILAALLLAPALLAAIFLNRQSRTLGPLFLLITSGLGLAVVVGVLARRPLGVGDPDLWMVSLSALLVFAVMAMFVRLGLRALAWAYDRKRTSDLLFRLDVYWLLFTWIEVILGAAILAGNELGTNSGADVSTYRPTVLLPALGVATAFIAYRVVLRACLPWVRSTVPPPPGRTLLLLRVFGFNRRSQRWLEALGARWRYLGGVHLIVAPDLAVTTLDLPELLEFFRGRLARRFVASLADLETKLSGVDFAPDPDGRYRVTEFLCHADTWQVVMHRLAVNVDSVLMDLRGFGRGNHGCLYELRVLLGSVDLHKVVLLVDATTDRKFLEQSLVSIWRETGPDSLNASLDLPVVRFFTAPSANHGRAMHRLISHLCTPGSKSM